MRISADDLRAMGQIDIESGRFIEALRRDAALVNDRYGADAPIVLLASIATGK